MTKINLPINIFLSYFPNESMDFKEEIETLINRTTEEINHLENNFVEETELINYFRNQSDYFKSISDFLNIFEQKNTIYTKIKEVTELKNQQNDFVSLADGIASLFEEFKCNLKPEIDLEGALKMHHPGFPFTLEEDLKDLNYEEMNKLLKIYLLKENLEDTNYEIKNGILTIFSQNFVLKLTLCGEINNPQWKVFDINRENKVQYLIELPNSIKNLNTMLKIYEGKEECKQIYEALINDIYFNKFVSGSKFDFEFDFILKMNVKIGKSGIIGSIHAEGNKILYKKQILTNYENEVTKVLKKIDLRANFSIKNRITLTDIPNSFNSILELNEFLFEEREKKCFFFLFKDLKNKINFQKEEFGKNTAVLFSECIFIFCLDNLNYKKNDFLESELFLRIYVINSLERGITIPLELHLGIENDIYFITNKKINNCSISVKNFQLFLEKSVFLKISYSFFIKHFRIKIYKNGISIDDKIQITKGNNNFIINNKFIIEELKGIEEYINFTGLTTHLINNSIILGEKNDTFICKYNDLEFFITFYDKIIIKSENKALEKYMKSKNSFLFLNNFLYCIKKGIFPSLIGNNFLFFNFKNSLKTSFCFKIEKQNEIMIYKNEFIKRNFNLKEFFGFYYLISSNDLRFFDKFILFYYKDRFYRLANELKRHFNVSVMNQMMEFTHISKYAISLKENELIIENTNLPKEKNEFLVSCFFYEEDFVINFVKVIQTY